MLIKNLNNRVQYMTATQSPSFVSTGVFGLMVFVLLLVGACQHTPPAPVVDLSDYRLLQKAERETPIAAVSAVSYQNRSNHKASLNTDYQINTLSPVKAPEDTHWPEVKEIIPSHVKERIKVLSQKKTLGQSSSTKKQPQYHQVKKGDTLYSIASHYGVAVKTIAQINHLKQHRIYPGQKLSLQTKLNTTSKPLKHNKKTVKISKKLIANKQTYKAAGKVASQQKTQAKKVIKKSVQKKPVQAKSVRNGQKATRTTQRLVKNFKNRWHWPLKGPLIEPYSASLNGNKGLNIQGNYGSPVRAAAGGQVVYRGNGLKGYGNLVIVKHNNDYLSAYAYNSKIHVKENEIVKAGQIIADTGRNDGGKEMLHFEIRHQGKPVNPLKYLPKL